MLWRCFLLHSSEHSTAFPECWCCVSVQRRSKLWCNRLLMWAGSITSSTVYSNACLCGHSTTWTSANLIPKSSACPQKICHDFLSSCVTSQRSFRERADGRWRDSCLSMPMARSRSASWRSTGRGVCLLHTCHVAKLSTIFCVQRLVWSAQHLSTSGASNTIRQTNTNCGAVRGNRELRMWREQTPSLLPILDGYCMRGGLFLMWFIQSPRAFDGLCRVYCCVGRVGAMCICVCVCVTVCGVGAEGILMPDACWTFAPLSSYGSSRPVCYWVGGISSCFWSFLFSSLFPSLVFLSVRLYICLQFWPPWRARVDCEGKTIQAYTPKYRHCGLNTWMLSFGIRTRTFLSGRESG